MWYSKVSNNAVLFLFLGLQNQKEGRVTGTWIDRWVEGATWRKLWPMGERSNQQGRAGREGWEGIHTPVSCSGHISNLQWAKPNQVPDSEDLLMQSTQVSPRAGSRWRRGQNESGGANRPYPLLWGTLRWTGSKVQITEQQMDSRWGQKLYVWNWWKKKWRRQDAGGI